MQIASVSSWPSSLARSSRRQGVGGLARLRDRHHQRLGIGDGVAVTVLAGDLHIGWHAGDGLQPVTRDTAGVIAGAAGKDGHGLDSAEDSGGFLAEQFGSQAARQQGVLQRVGQCARLLVDFLLHEMAVGAELGHVGGKLGDVHLARDFAARAIDDAHAQQAQVGDVALLQVDHALGHRQQGGGVGSDEVFLDAKADDERAAAARGHQLMRRIPGDDADGIGARELPDRGPDGEEQITALLVMEMHQVDDDLGVGLRFEAIAERP